VPPQTDRLQILRAVLANLAGRGAIPTDAFGQTALGGQSAPNLTNQFGQTALGGSNSPSSVASPSGFDATMRDVRLPPRLLSKTDPYYSSLEANVPSGDWFATGPRSASINNYGTYGRTALGGKPHDEVGLWWTSPTQRTFRNADGSTEVRTVDSKSSKSKSSSKSSDKFISNKMESDMVTAPPRQTNPDVTGFDAAIRGEGASDKARQSQSSSKPSPSAETKPTQSKKSPPNAQASSPASSQSSKGGESSKSAPVAQAEPSGEALSYFRKNKQSAGWDALGTAVSLVQRSLSPDKGGLKSRAEYDRLLRGSDNFKKLDGDEQQRVRQAFAQWMNEQTIFKGKA